MEALPASSPSPAWARLADIKRAVVGCMGGSACCAQGAGHGTPWPDIIVAAIMITSNYFSRVTNFNPRFVYVDLGPPAWLRSRSLR
jgi:hypothetical protein